MGDVFGRNQSGKSISKKLGEYDLTVEPDDGVSDDYEYEDLDNPDNSVKSAFNIESWIGTFQVTRPAGKFFKLRLSGRLPGGKVIVVLCKDSSGGWRELQSGGSINGLRVPVGDPAIGIR